MKLPRGIGPSKPLRIVCVHFLFVSVLFVYTEYIILPEYSICRIKKVLEQFKLKFVLHLECNFEVHTHKCIAASLPSLFFGLFVAIWPEKFAY